MITLFLLIFIYAVYAKGDLIKNAGLVLIPSIMADYYIITDIAKMIIIGE